MRDGTRTRARSARLSERKVVSAKRRRIHGSAAQKLASNSAASSGRSALPATTGAR
jgi:hypothetical protein